MSSKDSEVRCACGRLLARIVTADTGMHYELRRRGKPVAVVTSGELHCGVCGESVRVGGIEHGGTEHEQESMLK